MTEAEARRIAREAVARRRATFLAGLSRADRLQVRELTRQQARPLSAPPEGDPEREAVFRIYSDSLMDAEELRGSARELSTVFFEEFEGEFHAWPTTEQGRVFWEVGQEGRGSLLTVLINDATGEIVEIRKMGTR